MEEKWTISQIKEYLLSEKVSTRMLDLFYKDSRTGVTKLLSQYEKRIAAKHAEEIS